jgi:hypothetical protein
MADMKIPEIAAKFRGNQFAKGNHPIFPEKWHKKLSKRMENNQLAKGCIRSVETRKLMSKNNAMNDEVNRQKVGDKKRGVSLSDFAKLHMKEAWIVRRKNGKIGASKGWETRRKNLAQKLRVAA